MSTAEEILAGPSILTPRQRRNPIELLDDPTDEELARDWTLSHADKAEVLRCRTERHRLSFAIQLCVLRAHGRFLADFDAVGVRITNHLCRQLDLPPVLFVNPPQREATDLGHEYRIREYLGFRPFETTAQERLERAVQALAEHGHPVAEVFRHAEGLLRSWKVILPAPATLERIVASVTSRSRQEVIERIADRLTPEVRDAIDALIQVPEGDRRSELFEFKQYPPEANAAALLAHLDRLDRLRSLGVGQIDLTGIGTVLVQELAQLTRRYDADDLKRFASSKRYALVACFLAEARKTLLDQAVALNDQYLTTMCRRSRNAFETRHREFRRRVKKGLETLMAAAEILVDPQQPRATILDVLDRQIDRGALRAARDDCREFQRLEERGYVDELGARYAYLRRYLPSFFDLPFQGETGAGPLLEGLSLARALNRGERKELPLEAPIEFIPAAWRAASKRDDGTPDRCLWEIALALAVRDALRSGDLFLPESRRHVSFWNLLTDERQWTEQREAAYAALALPSEADRVLERLTREFDDVAWRTERGLGGNPFAAVRDGRLHLKRPDALEVSPRVEELRRAIETHLPRVRIESLIGEVDSWCRFTGALKPLGDYQPHSDNLDAALPAALIAHGTNLGIAAMGHSAEGVSVDMLQHVSRWFLREETLRAANAVLVDYHNRLDLSAVWGDGARSSSDGQRFGVQASSLLGALYPRYFGYYDRAVTVYTHTSDQHSVFGTRAISCAMREAVYVLDGLLENDTILRPREHSTDTHGATEHLFGLCYLLGYTFMPRLRGLADQQLYKVDRGTAYGRLEPLFRGAIDAELIREQWDQLVRIASSLRQRTAPAHVVVQRLAGSSPSDRVARALTALGRVVKTVSILRYLHEEEVRRRVQLQLNRGESRHDLARWLFFANQGEFRTGDYEEIMNKASCLSLLSNAVLVWNTVQMGEIVARLRAAGETVSDEDLARVSPLAYAHVIPNGTYVFDRAQRGVNIAPNTLP
jgi:TnpA family transposase